MINPNGDIIDRNKNVLVTNKPDFIPTSEDVQKTFARGEQQVLSQPEEKSTGLDDKINKIIEDKIAEKINSIIEKRIEEALKNI